MASEETRPSFRQQLQTQWDAGKFVCVGLDPDWDKIPPHLKEKFGGDRAETIWVFIQAIIDATSDLVLAYKPNIAFYENTSEGAGVLERVAPHIRQANPNISVIGDVKRADIGNTNRGYADMAFRRYGFDAITTNPYFGHDTYPPFLSHRNSGLIILCKTTNPGAALYQDAPIRLEYYQLQQERNGTPLTQEEYDRLKGAALGARSEQEIDLYGSSTIPLYWIVAARTATLARENPNIGLVVGATHPEAFQPIRYLVEDTPFLIPGIGTQGGDLEKTLKFAPDSRRQGVIINSASGIIFASSGEDFADKARAATVKLDKQIREGLENT